MVLSALLAASILDTDLDTVRVAEVYKSGLQRHLQFGQDAQGDGERVLNPASSLEGELARGEGRNVVAIACVSCGNEICKGW